MWCPVNRDLGCIEISPIEVVSLLEAQFKNWSATPVVVATSVVDLVVTRSGATVVGQGKMAIWLVVAIIVLSDPAETLPCRTT